MRATVKIVCLAVALLGWGGMQSARADDLLKRIQQALHDQGFYYGPIDGAPGDETTHAISRYQIRNGLAVTGQLNDETTRSINRAGSAPVAGAGRITGSDPRTGNDGDVAEDRRYPQGDGRRATPAPAPAYHPPPPSNRPDPGGGDDDDDSDAAPAARAPVGRPDLRAVPPDADRAGSPRGPGVAPSEELTGVFERTPYEFAPPPVQADVLRRAQTILRHDGFYDGETSGRPNPVTFEALTNFQGVNHLRRTGRLDIPTLDLMRLLPGRRPGPAPEGERRRGPDGVYEGRVVR